MASTQDIYVSLKGDDRWSGLRAGANRDGTDGPLATIPKAIRLARTLRRESPDTPVRILLRGGTHRLKKPLELDHRDSGMGPDKARGQARIGEERPMVLSAYKDEKPIVSGGVQITGFRETEHAGHRAWVVDLPAVQQGKLGFRQLFVNDERRSRPRWPRQGFHSIQSLAPGPEADSWKRGYNDRFHYHAGDLQAWHRLQDVELVLLQVWIESRLWLKELDEKKRLAIFDRFSTSGLSADPNSGSAWFLENVAEALDTPGEWYLDRGAGRLTYLPLPGERLKDARIEVPILPHLLIIKGEAAKKRVAEYIRFEGIRFSHTEWSYEAPLSGCEQAARMVPAAVQLIDAERVRFHQCEFSHIGNWGAELLEGSRDNGFYDCRFIDLGGGGVKAWHGTQRTTVSDCEIAGCGRIFYSAVGVLVGNSGANRILHNHIHDVRYTGISLGWHWGYDLVGNQGNIVEYNHIHDIGAGYLSDMGGIYVLGPQQGSRLRYNHIHDVKSRTYGGWGIYPDEGCSDLLVEKNLVHDCNRALFHQHYGRDNMVVNNIFAFGTDGQMQVSCPEAHTSCHFHRNIVLFDSGQLLTPPGGGAIEQVRVEADHNIYHDLRGKRMDFGGMSWSAWRAAGRDRHSLLTDPLFTNAAKRDFTLKRRSPALGLGFEPFDLSTVGPRTGS
ncbi:MAG: hypothetical protein HN712_03260 [Gemmatimonadetes bacterium]|jgi:hypothetical protein|nr:hypothetical protein [Gemmatimonadota bacterium]MBT6147406.1 hypothetical protein [Gemmatimonadota bacterium]MBT7859297.1 hypothetical protein [Gemmatimonadota bacterium]